MTPTESRHQARGSARIQLWPGGSAWVGQAEGATDVHSHHAIQIALAPGGGRMRFRPPDGDWQAYAAVVIAAHQEHAFDALGDRVAFLFVEPETREGRAIRARFPAGISALDEDLLAQTPTLVAACGENGHAIADAELVAAARALIAALAACATPVALPDARIARAIALLRAGLQQPVSLDGIAAAVHLSPERFRRLFLQETGSRFRPYVLWLRLEVAIAAYAGGQSLTDAASAAGFADSAHFARTFRRMFGIAATSLRPE